VEHLAFDSSPQTARHRRVGPRQFLTELTLRMANGLIIRRLVRCQEHFQHVGPNPGLIAVTGINPQAHLNVRIFGSNHGDSWVTRSLCRGSDRIHNYTLVGDTVVVTTTAGTRATPTTYSRILDLATGELLARHTDQESNADSSPQSQTVPV
jgi:hypothetical protein